jgi:hypothetical protein
MIWSRATTSTSTSHPPNQSHPTTLAAVGTATAADTAATVADRIVGRHREGLGLGIQPLLGWTGGSAGVGVHQTCIHRRRRSLLRPHRAAHPISGSTHSYFVTRRHSLGGSPAVPMTPGQQYTESCPGRLVHPSKQQGWQRVTSSIVATLDWSSTALRAISIPAQTSPSADHQGVSLMLPSVVSAHACIPPTSEWPEPRVRRCHVNGCTNRPGQSISQS